MKIMEKAKRFFTLNAAKHEGFTLVELIVVIAILAILAGVAVPAYSGYIAKSREAADQTLVGAVNKAFASACIEGGVDVYMVTSADINVSAQKIGNVTAVAASGIDSNDVAKIQNSFNALFTAENPDAKFEVFSDLAFDASKHAFVGVNEGEIIEQLKVVIGNSNYNGKLTELTGDVAGLVNNLKDYMDSAGVQSIIGSGFSTYMDEVLGLEDPDSQEMANAAVLYLAHTASGMTSDDVDAAKMNVAGLLMDYASKISNDDPNDNTMDRAQIESLVGGSSLAGYAALYATAEAIALSQGENSAAYAALQNANPSDPASVVNSVVDVFNAAGSDALMNYVGEDMNNSSLINDMDAYFQTLQAVNSKEDELKGQLDSTTMFTEDATIQDLLAKLQG